MYRTRVGRYFQKSQKKIGRPLWTFPFPFSPDSWNVALHPTPTNFFIAFSKCSETFEIVGFYIFALKWVHPIIFSSNVFHNSHLIQLLLILYTLLKQMRVVKNIRRKHDRITSFQKNLNFLNFCWMIRTQPISLLKLFLF